MSKQKITKTTRIVFSLALIPLGGILVLIASTTPNLGTSAKLISDIGLSLVVAGVTSAFHDLVLAESEKGEIGEEVAEKVHKKLVDSPPGETGTQIAEMVYERILECPPDSAIRMVSEVRRGYDGYYQWAVVNKAQNLFFAGRSVLHRVEDDFENRGLKLEDVILRKMGEGSVIRIMFLDLDQI